MQLIFIFSFICINFLIFYFYILNKYMRFQLSDVMSDILKFDERTKGKSQFRLPPCGCKFMKKEKENYIYNNIKERIKKPL